MNGDGSSLSSAAEGTSDRKLLNPKEYDEIPSSEVSPPPTPPSPKRSQPASQHFAIPKDATHSIMQNLSILSSNLAQLKGVLVVDDIHERFGQRIFLTILLLLSIGMQILSKMITFFVMNTDICVLHDENGKIDDEAVEKRPSEWSFALGFIHASHCMTFATTLVNLVITTFTFSTGNGGK
ncbi:uncharacterized protein LOC135503100 [Lineus longissimus]|uniref:uncharacterized protein LOC135503100 n=1 Tax=Lineus longissimus TaxID=88925 RepID=UPI002B4D72F5